MGLDPAIYSRTWRGTALVHRTSPGLTAQAKIILPRLTDAHAAAGAPTDAEPYVNRFGL
jgi:hypothetical protein